MSVSSPSPTFSTVTPPTGESPLVAERTGSLQPPGLELGGEQRLSPTRLGHPQPVRVHIKFSPANLGQCCRICVRLITPLDQMLFTGHTRYRAKKALATKMLSVAPGTVSEPRSRIWNFGFIFFFSLLIKFAD